MSTEPGPISGASRLGELRGGFGADPFGSTARPLPPPPASPPPQPKMEEGSSDKTDDTKKKGPSARRKPQAQGRKMILHAIISEEGHKALQVERDAIGASFADIVGLALENLTQVKLSALMGDNTPLAKTMPPSPGRGRMRRKQGERDITFAVTPEQRDWFERERSHYGDISMARLNGFAVEAYFANKRSSQEGK